MSTDNARIHNNLAESAVTGLDGSLLQMFVTSVRESMIGRVIGPVRWYRPILSVPIGRRKQHEYLVAILGLPGPFCYLSPSDPLDGVTARDHFPLLDGARITGMSRPANERILVMEAEPVSETVGDLQLRLSLFGSAGRAELSRGDSVIQSVGGRQLSDRPPVSAGRTPPVESPNIQDNTEPAEGDPFCLASNTRLGLVAPSPPSQESRETLYCFGPFYDAIGACRDAGEKILAGTYEEIIASRSRPVTRRLTKLGKLLEKLQREYDDTASHESIRREAETLAAFQSKIKPGIASMNLPDVYDPEVTLHIRLDPALPVRVQIEKRFKRAAKLVRSREHIHRRMDEVSAEIDEKTAALEAAVSAVSFSAAISAVDGLLANTRTGRPPGKGNGQPAAVSFRNYELDEMWFVLVGRNNKENDELTFHAAAPTDYWFHAQHVPGSHVVLKSRGNPGAPPPRILDETAAIAAYFSKAKHSNLVPVIYTLRKYVRKPRGAKAGTVVCEREKTIMATPSLPKPHK